jgi:hypothetical protein
VLRTFVRRWLGLGSEETSRKEPEDALARRVDSIEERLDFLAGALSRLRGRVTGGLRGEPEAEGNGTESSPTSPRGNPQALALLAKRRAHVP